jgi:hypothetical protein
MSIEKYLIWRFKTKTFSRAIIETMHYHFNIIISDYAEFALLWEVLSDQAIRIVI